MTPTRSRLLATMAMLAFVVAFVGTLTFHPRTDSIEAATESPLTEPVRATAIETSSTATAPTTTAVAPRPSSTTPPTTRKPSPPTTVKPFIPSSTVPKRPSTTTTKPAQTTTVAPTTTAKPKPLVAVQTPAPAPAQVAPKPTVPAAPAPTTPPATTPPGNSSDAAFLACVKRRESGGNYQAVGAGYYGAYQFSQSTWDGTARHAGRGDLVGVRPDRAGPADQDAMAWHLLGWQGRAPWGGSCR